MTLYAVTADYRPNNSIKPVYYVYGENKFMAKKRFLQRINWLKIYTITKVNKEEEIKIIEEPMKHIIF